MRQKEDLTEDAKVILEADRKAEEDAEAPETC